MSLFSFTSASSEAIQDFLRYDQFLGVSLTYYVLHAALAAENKTCRSFFGKGFLYICFDVHAVLYRGADKSLARPGRKQATATEDFDFHISYL